AVPAPVTEPAPAPDTAPETPDKPPKATEPRRKQPKEEKPDKPAVDKPRAPEKAPSPAAGSGAAPRTQKEADALLKEARAARDKLQWDKARARYEQVVASKFGRDEAYLGLAEVAFQTKRADEIIGYAKRAGNGIRARVLLGHGYFQKQEYGKALKLYESVLADKPDHTEAQNAAKAARLKLKSQ
ncbi:MAG TPA: tetratricopeptide repeat protein, partial [Kofleriaceae bacterium]|nr:tetratricopeptide repeat protein [Kofleriaceae bacterium]